VKYIDNWDIYTSHRFPLECDLTRLDLGPLSEATIKEFMNVVDFFEVTFAVKQILPRDMNVADECYRWEIKQLFDFSYRGSVASSQSIGRTICDGYQCKCQAANVWKNYQWIAVITGSLALISLLLVWNSFRGRMIMVSKLQSVNSWRDLEFTEKVKFFNVANIITIIGNLCQFFSKLYPGFLIAVSNPNLTFSVFEVLTGVGCFCAWINILDYLDHTSESFIVVNTFKRAYDVLLLYMLGLFPIYLGYSFLGMTLFWQSGYFLDLLGSMMILFAMVNGDSIDLFFSTMLPINYFFAQIYFYSFVVLFICVVQNIFISIINNAFESFKTRPVKEVGDTSDDEEEKLEESGSGEAQSLILKKPNRRNTKNVLDRGF